MLTREAEAQNAEGVQRKKIVHANAILKEKLAGFWQRFAGEKRTHYAPSVKLQALREMAEVRIPYKKQSPLSRRREQFDRVKHRLCRARLGSKCFVCFRPGFNRHHIVQLNNGGINSRRNLVILCNACHAQVHPWLSIQL